MTDTHSPDAPLKCAIAGCGGIARVHLDAMKNIPDIEPAACLDADIAAAQQMAAQAGCPAFDDLDKMLDCVPLDCLIVSTPPAFHADIACKVLDRGIHVLCEKPVAINLAQAQTMAAAAQKNGVRLIPAFCHRFAASSAKMRDMILQDSIGSPALVNILFCGDGSGLAGRWFSNRALSGGGVIMDTLVHSIDLFHYLAGYAVEVHCTATCGILGLDVEDTALVNLKSPDGVIGDLFGSWATPSGCARIEIMGSKGTLFFDYNIPDILVWRRSGMGEEHISIPSASERFTNQLRHFAGLVRGRAAAPVISERDAVESMRVAEECMTAAIKTAPGGIKGMMTGMPGVMTAMMRTLVAALCLQALTPAPVVAQKPPNNTIDVLKTTADYTRQCQWPDGNITFKPEPPDKDVRGFVDHPAQMAENVARCYLYTGDKNCLDIMRKAIDFLTFAEPKRGQYYGGTNGKETFAGMDAYGCWAQAFSIPVAWYYMLTGDHKIIEQSHKMIADAYDHHIEQFPFQTNTYNHERLLYWKGLVMARAMMQMAGDTQRAAKYEKTIRLWRESFDYGWYEAQGLFSQWPYIEYDWNLERLKLNAYLMPFYMADTPKPDPFWAYWEYAYTSSPNIYYDSWLLDETLHARILKAMRSLDANLPSLPDWLNFTKYAKPGEVGNWVSWYLLRFMHDAFVLNKGVTLYNNYFDFRGWPPQAGKGYEVSNLIPMADFAHYFFYVTPKFRFPIGKDTHLGDVLVLAATGGGPEATVNPGAFHDAAIKHHDIIHYSALNPKKAMEAFERVDLDNYRVIIIANRHAGNELAGVSGKLLDWVERGGSLVLLNTGTNSECLAWLPGSVKLDKGSGNRPIRDPDAAQGMTTHPLLNRPNKLTSGTLQDWGKSAEYAFANTGPGWESVVVRSSDQASLLMHRRHGKGWICATTIDAAGAQPHPPLIRNIMEYARNVSGEIPHDAGADARNFKYPDKLPVLPHIEDPRFFNASGNEIPYPLASNRTEPFKDACTARFRLVSPVAGTPATLIIPAWKGYAVKVKLDGTEQAAEPKQYMDLSCIVIDTTASDNRVEVLYTPDGRAEGQGGK